MIPYRSYTLGKALYIQGLDDTDRNLIKKLSKTRSKEQQKQEFSVIIDSYKSRDELKEAIGYVQQDIYENGILKNYSEDYNIKDKLSDINTKGAVDKGFRNISSYGLLNLYKEFFGEKKNTPSFRNAIDIRRIMEFDKPSMVHSMNSVSFIKQKINLYMGYNIYNNSITHGNFLQVNS